MSEAMVLATKAGADPERMYQVIRGGLAGSTVLDAKAPMVLDRNFKPCSRIDLHQGVNQALDTSHGVRAHLPLTTALMELMKALKQDDLGNADHSAVPVIMKNMAILSCSGNDVIRRLPGALSTSGTLVRRL